MNEVDYACYIAHLKTENEMLKKQVDNLAKMLVDMSEFSKCEKLCPIDSDPFECSCECFDAEKWKERAKNNVD